MSYDVRYAAGQHVSASLGVSVLASRPGVGLSASRRRRPVPASRLRHKWRAVAWRGVARVARGVARRGVWLALIGVAWRGLEPEVFL